MSQFSNIAVGAVDVTPYFWFRRVCL